MENVQALLNARWVSLIPSKGRQVDWRYSWAWLAGVLPNVFFSLRARISKKLRGFRQPLDAHLDPIEVRLPFL
jgi:hypothetical protein